MNETPSTPPAIGSRGHSAGDGSEPVPAKYGFKPDQKWLNSLRLGSLRLGGEDVLSGFGSASFVSPKGLIMTNNRCARDAVASTLDGLTGK